MAKWLQVRRSGECKSDAPQNVADRHIKSMDQPRAPRGTPIGGRWSETSTKESKQSLTRARVYGQVSAYASGLAELALADANQATKDAAALTERAADLRRKADSIKATANTRGALRRWVGNRKANKTHQEATSVVDQAKDQNDRADKARQEAGRMGAGVDAEQSVVDTLASTHGVDEILCGLNLGPGIGDIDVVAIGSRVVVVEVKAGGGALSYTRDGSVTHGERKTPGQPLDQCRRQVAALKEMQVEAVGVVSFPSAAPGEVFDATSGCWLIGGKDALSGAVNRIMSEHTLATASSREVIASVQLRLGARQEEISGWIASVQEQNEAAEQRVAKWSDTIDRSAGWSKGPEIRSNLGGLIADNRRKILERTHKAEKWLAMYHQVGEAVERNRKLAQNLD